MRSLLLPDVESAASSFAPRAEDLGYDGVWVGELWGADAFLQLATVAERTDDLALGTAIANVFSRSPATLAQAAATLDDLAPGRVRLGVGTSTRKAVEDLHGAAFERPVRRVHEAVELVKAFTAGEGRVEYDGELFSVADFPALDADVPVFTAALGPANRRATGRVADGWLPHNVPFPMLDEAFETVADAAQEADRDPDEVSVAPYVPSAVSDDSEEARAVLRGHVAYYVGSGEGYRRAVAEVFPDEAATVAEAWRGGDRGAAREAVTDEMVDALGVAGTPEEARERFRDVAGRPTVDETVLVVPASADENLVERTVTELAPSKL